MNENTNIAITEEMNESTSRDYKATFVQTAYPLSVKDRIRKKEIGSAFRIDKVLDSMDGNAFTLTALSFWGVIHIHNEMSDNKDYEVYLFESEDGSTYVTSSKSTWKSFMDIKEELATEGEDILGNDLEFTRQSSKDPNKKGFIVCKLG